MSYRVVQPERIKLDDGGSAEITRHGTAILRTEGPAIWLGLYDVVELARRCAGSDHELLKALSTVMARGHRFTDDPCPTTIIDDEESW